MILDFDEENENNQGYWYLPSGIHEATWNEFCDRFITGLQREKLKQGMEPMLQNLRDAGCKSVKIDGSFVTSKLNPNDFDGTWNPDGVDFTILDSVINAGDKLLMKEKYLGELYRQDLIEAGSGKTFDEFFQIDRLK